MTDHPDAITVAKCHPFRGDNFYITLPGSDRSGVGYIRADIAAAKNKAHEKEIAVWSENYAALERQLAEALAEVRALKADRDALQHFNRQLRDEITEYQMIRDDLVAEVARLKEALADHNDLLRSAMQIAKREGVEGEIGSTNWDAYYNRVAVVLKRHHDTAKLARAALQHTQGDAG